MKREHPDFSDLMEHAAGRASEDVAAHLGQCERCGEELALARLMLEAGRRALQPAQVGARARRRAIRAFRDVRRGSLGAEILRIVSDSFLRPAAALRDAPVALPRFLQLRAGDVVVDMYVTKGRRGLDVRGQITPSDLVGEVTAESKDREFRARVDGGGEFAVRGLPRGSVSIRIGRFEVRDLEL